MTTLGRANFSLMKHCIRNSLLETRCVIPMTRNAHTKETHPTKYDENINAKCRMRGIGILRDPKLNKVCCVEHNFVLLMSSSVSVMSSIVYNSVAKSNIL